MIRSLLRRRALPTAAAAVFAGAVSVAAVSYAQDGPTQTPAPAAAPGGILAGVHRALEDLVSQGTITQTQADAVQQQADAGSIDPKSLVQAGVLTDAQMQVVANSLDQVKEAGGRQ